MRLVQFLESTRAGSGISPTDLPKETQYDIAANLIDMVPELSGENEEHVAGYLDFVDMPDVQIVDVNPESLYKQFTNRRVSDTAASKYANMIRSGVQFDPVLVAGNRFIDGGHRVKAYMLAGKNSMRAVDISPLLSYDWRDALSESQINEGSIKYLQLVGGGIEFLPPGSGPRVPSLVLLPSGTPNLQTADTVRAISIKTRTGNNRVKQLVQQHGPEAAGVDDFVYLWNQAQNKTASTDDWERLIGGIQRHPDIFKIIDLRGAAEIFKFVTTDLRLPVVVYRQFFGEPPKLAKKDTQKFHNAQVFFPETARASTRKAMAEVLELVYQQLKGAGFEFLFHGDIRFVPLGGKQMGNYSVQGQDIRVSPRIKASKKVLFNLIHEYGHKLWYEYLSEETKKVVKSKYIELFRSRIRHQKDIKQKDETERLMKQFSPGMTIEYMGRKEGFKKYKFFKITKITGDKFEAVATRGISRPVLAGSLLLLFKPRRWRVVDHETEFPSEPTQLYDLESEQWFPTKYSETDHEEWLSELFAFHVLGNLQGEPEEWMRQILGK